MKIRFVAIPLFTLAIVSCEKVRNLVGKASTAASQQLAAKVGGGGGAKADAGKVDAELQKLVDQNADGAVFRKDLPFPKRLEVRTTRRGEMSGRVFQTSAIEKRAEVRSGTQTDIFKLERAGGQVRYTLERSDFTLPTPNEPEAGKKSPPNPLEQMAFSRRPVTFRKTGSAWKSDERDGFRATAISKQLAPVFEQILMENALEPRGQWFAKRRIKVGDRIVVTGGSLPMLVAGDVKGSLTLQLESFEPVGGHPCGVFSITGDYDRKQFPDFEGNPTDENVSIQSGKIWLSLIHPIILREELDTIRTSRSGEQGGLVARSQGSAKISVIREWKVPAS